MWESWDPPVRFDSLRRLIVEPWQGDFWILVAGMTVKPQDQTLSLSRELEQLGFRIPTRMKPSGKGPDGTSRCLGLSRVEDSLREGVNVVGDLLSCGDDWPELEEEWDVVFPHQLVGYGWLEGALQVHEFVSSLRRKLSQDLSGVPLLGMGLREIAANLSKVIGECDWWEGLLAAYQPVAEVPISIKSISTEVSLRQDEPPAVEQFLQTRTVSLEEARGELDSWKQPAEDELQALEVTTEAVERVTARDVEEWVRKGKKVIQVPGKAVLTRKSGIGKRRFRAVCCGNCVPLSELNVTKDELYAGGIDAITFRAVLAYSAQFAQWTACTLDIKTAFLNAPVRGGGQVEGTEDPLIIVRPPFLLVQLGLLQSHHRWLVRRALYGLQTSPRDWAQHRDKILAGIRLKEAQQCALVQSVTDESLWLLKGANQTIEALVMVYVDDMAIFGPAELLEKLVAEIQSIWTISGPNWVAPESPLNFGMELTRQAYGWKVTQEKYLRELLLRYEVTGGVSSPMLKFDEPPLEDVTPTAVKDAQGITGALMWAVTRSRPDLMFVTSKMSQWCTKSPLKVKEWGLHALRYVSVNLSLGLEFRECPGPCFGSQDQLAVPREPRYLEVYSDASHSPGGGRSTQSTLIIWRGALVAWETSRQPFVTLSSAEAELVSMMHSVVSSESIGPIVEELLQEDVVTSLLGDNSAALSAFNLTPSGWRSRPLRMRANAGRERIRAGTLTTSYIPGELQVADIGTKALPGHKLQGLLELINVRSSPGSNLEPVVAKAFGRMCSVSLTAAESVSPAVLMVLVVLSCPDGVLGARVPAGMLGSAVVLSTFQGVQGQPEVWLWLVGNWVFWVLWILVSASCVVWVLLGSWLVSFRVHEDSQAPTTVHEDSQAHTTVHEDSQAHIAVHEDSQAHTAVHEDSQAHTAVHEDSQAHTAVHEDLQAHTAVHEDSQAYQEAQSSLAVLGDRVEGSTSLGSTAEGVQGVECETETCEFPIVGRIDGRSNWVPSHYLRWLLSLVGESLIQFLGLTAVEAWRLRAIGRSYRYGVAISYERAMGLGPMPRRGGAGQVHDIADAALVLGPEGMQPGFASQDVATMNGDSPGFASGQGESTSQSGGSTSIELSQESEGEAVDDPAIDEVRHIPPQNEAVELLGGGLAAALNHLLEPSSGSSYQSTTTASASSLGGVESTGDGLLQTLVQAMEWRLRLGTRREWLIGLLTGV